MERELKIDRAIYVVDDDTQTYRFLKRNPEWRDLCAAENEANKTQLDGYVRVFRSGKSATFSHAKQSTEKVH